MPAAVTIPDAIQIPEDIAQNVTVMPLPTTVAEEEAQPVPPETVNIINQIE